MPDNRPAEGGQRAERTASEAEATSDPRPRSLPRTQPARALVSAFLYVGAVTLVGLLLQLLATGYALLLFCVLVAVGLLVPFIVLGQRPDAPERAARPSFPVLGQPGALPFGRVSNPASPHASEPHPSDRVREGARDTAPVAEGPLPEQKGSDRTG